MARGINKVILIGNLGKDPETRYTPAGAAITNITVATSENWKDKQTGQNQERTEWHRVVCFNRLAEIAGEYLKKGAKVYIEGSLRTREWQDKEGQKRYTTEIVANDLQMLDSRGGGGGGGSGTGAGSAMDSDAGFDQGFDQSPAPAAPRGRGGNAPQQPPARPADTGGFDDDIPF